MMPSIHWLGEKPGMSETAGGTMPPAFLGVICQ